MAQQMTMEERNSPDDGIREVHYQIDASSDRDVHCIQPLRAFEASPVLGLGKKVNLECGTGELHEYRSRLASGEMRRWIRSSWEHPTGHISFH
jgi:hypothetical protein